MVGFRKLCGNCEQRGHQAVTCRQPCFACGGNHKYFQCDDPDLLHDALRQANRNRVKWQGLGAKTTDKKGKTGMTESGAGRHWIRQPYDPEYVPARERSPKRAYLDKVSHASDRCKTYLRILWEPTEPEAMDALINNGFSTDVCLDRSGCEVHCKGTLKVHYYASGDRFDRKLHCHGVPEKARHRFHWLSGSIFHGHHKLDTADVCGVVQCFSAGKSVETASQDTGLYWGTVGGALRQTSHCRHTAGSTTTRRGGDVRNLSSSILVMV